MDFQGGGALYSYDGASLRVKKVSGGTTTVYIFSGTKVIAEYVNGAMPGSPTREYIYSGSQLLVTVAGSTTTYHHADHLSVRVNADGTPGSPTFGEKNGERGHLPFGETWYENGGGTTKWKFTSYERDGESGLDYAMARYHGNRFGRFLSPDPIAGSISDPQSFNRYAYARNDPVNLIDPLGLEPKCYTPDGKEVPCPDVTSVTVSGKGGPFETVGTWTEAVVRLRPGQCAEIWLDGVPTGRTTCETGVGPGGALERELGGWRRPQSQAPQPANNGTTPSQQPVKPFTLPLPNVPPGAACDKYSSSILKAICNVAGNNTTSNCVRGYLLNSYDPKSGYKGGLIPAHCDAWSSCGMPQPLVWGACLP